MRPGQSSGLCRTARHADGDHGVHPAKPGQLGHVSAVRKSEANALAGDVEIRCEAGRVDIEANQRGDLLGDKQFERGVFLGVTGRAGLEVVREGRDATGEVRLRSADASATNAGAPPVPASATAAPPKVEAVPGGTSLDVQMEALRGFASVLDFDADLSAGGVLPVRVSMRNSTRRSYDFDPSTLVLNVAGERTRVSPLTPTDAYSRLAAKADPSLGDIEAARALLAAKAITGGRLGPGATREGFVYFPLGNYDRARLSVTDTATGEPESFVVDF